MAGQDLFHQMDTSLKGAGFKPQYDYHSDSSRGPTHIIMTVYTEWSAEES